MIDNSIKITGISSNAQIFISRFMHGIPSHRRASEGLIPIIGLVKSSVIYIDDIQIERKEDCFVLGAIKTADIDDEIMFDTGTMKIAIRIPNIDRFYGSYEFDVVDEKIVRI